MTMQIHAEKGNKTVRNTERGTGDLRGVEIGRT